MYLSSRPPLALPAAVFIAALILAVFGAAYTARATGAVTVTPVTIASSNASTTLAMPNDVVTVTFTSNQAALVVPTGTINGHTATVKANGNYTSTSTATLWTGSAAIPSGDSNGTVTFSFVVGNSDGTATSSAVTATTNGSAVRFDKTAPTLNSAVWADTNGSGNIDAGDILTLTWSETMATSTLTTSNADTILPAGSHSYGATPTISWNAAGTVLQLTLGTGATAASGDAVTSILTDAAGNADGTVGGTLAARTLLDNISPASPTGLSTQYIFGSTSVTLSSTGSTQIRYTTDGTTPSCSSGTVYSGAFTVADTLTLAALGCDPASNASSVVTAKYTQNSGGGGGGGLPIPHSPPTTAPVPPAPSAPVQTIAPVPPVATPPSTTPAVVPAPTVKQTGPLFTKNLGLGATSADVKRLQQYLNTHGAPIAQTGSGSLGKETAYFGLKTKAALIVFQKDAGIKPANGYLGPVTRAYISTLP